MSDELARMRARLAALRQQNSTHPPTDGGGASGASAPRAAATEPVKPSDARGGGTRNTPPPPRPRAVPPAAFELPPSPAPRSGPNGRSQKGSLTLSVKQLRTQQLDEKRLGIEPVTPPPGVERPKTRGDCFGGERPCPYVSCRYHTYLEVTEAGSLVINRPDVDVADLKASCSLDVADAGPLTLEQTGAVLNLTRERMRQMETAALRKVKRLVDEKPDGEVRFRRQCTAVDAHSGRRCGLLEHEGPVHRSARGEFRVAAAPGQTSFTLQQKLDEQATRNPESVPALEASNV